MCCDFCLDACDLREPSLGACGLSVHLNLRLFVETGAAGRSVGVGVRDRAAAAKRGAGVPILSWLEWSAAERKAAAKLGAPRILDAGPDRSSRWKDVDDKAFETIEGIGDAGECTYPDRAASNAGYGDRRR